MSRFVLFAPSLLAVFPSLSLFLFNQQVIRMPWYEFSAALIGVGLVIFVIALCTQRFLKNKPKAVILLSLAVIFVFYYGFFFDIITSTHRYALSFWLLIFLAMGFLTWRASVNFATLSILVGIFSFTLVGSSLLFSFAGSLGSGSVLNQQIKGSDDFEPSSLEGSSPLLGYMPDVYYIVPDGYASSSVLEKFLGYDNHEFLSYLKDRGFVIIDDSVSIYGNTLYSLPSTLNMEYGDTLIPDFLSAPLGARRTLISNNKVAQLFKSLGYTYIAIASDDTTFGGSKADIRLGPSFLFRILIKPTIFDPFSQRFRDRILNAFRAFNDVTLLPSPKFVLAHILSPHDPYVFGSNGEDIGFHSGVARSPEDMKLYRGQVEFVNKKLKETVDIILGTSSRAPIIVIQSDHGVLLPSEYGEDAVRTARLQNFTALLLPGTAKSFLPESISTVNTFRFILDQYFGFSFGILEEQNF